MLTEYRAGVMRFIDTHKHLLEKYGISAVQYGPHQKLLQQAATPRSVFILSSGLVKVVHITSLGQMFTLGVFERGEVLGDAEAIMSMQYFGTVETVTYCTFWKIEPEQFLRMLAQEPGFNLLIHRAMVSRMLNTSEKAVIQGTNKLYYSLLIVLREFSRLNELRISKPLVADALGASVRNLNRLLVELEEGKILKIQHTILVDFNLQLLQQKIDAYENSIQ
jgi:CRP-like cAMP-binding protein